MAADLEKSQATQEDLMGDQSWAKTSEDDFTNEVEAMFAIMKETMGPAPTGPDVKMGALGDGQAGVDGFWVAGGTGESVLLSEQENMRLAELSVKQNRGRVINIHHVGAVTTRQCEALASETSCM